MATEAVLQTLRRLWEVLEAAGIQAAVAGGLALATWRHPRTTFDVDVLLIADRITLDDLTERLKSAGFTRRSRAPTDLGETELLQFYFEPRDAFVDVQVDLLVATSDYAREAISRSVVLDKEALGFQVNVLGCEDLIVFKEETASLWPSVPLSFLASGPGPVTPRSCWTNPPSCRISARIVSWLSQK